MSNSRPGPIYSARGLGCAARKEAAVLEGKRKDTKSVDKSAVRILGNSRRALGMEDQLQDRTRCMKKTKRRNKSLQAFVEAQSHLNRPVRANGNRGKKRIIRL